MIWYEIDCKVDDEWSSHAVHCEEHNTLKEAMNAAQEYAKQYFHVSLYKISTKLFPDDPYCGENQVWVRDWEDGEYLGETRL